MLTVNDYPINITHFPDKTSQVWKLSDYLMFNVASAKEIVITWEFEGEDEFLQLMQLTSLLERVRKNSHKITHLNVPYLPYARQDKDINNESCFALHVLVSFLRLYSKVTTFDVHNPDFFKRLCYFENILPTNNVKKIIAEHKADVLVLPDKGALARYGNLIDIPTYAADKIRDQSTGEIIDYRMDNKPPMNQVIVVQDDLCDGGRTFIDLAELLKPCSPKSLILYVSHGIFSRGTKCLFDAGYSEIYTRKGRVEKC